MACFDISARYRLQIRPGRLSAWWHRPEGAAGDDRIMRPVGDIRLWLARQMHPRSRRAIAGAVFPARHRIQRQFMAEPLHQRAQNSVRIATAGGIIQRLEPDAQRLRRRDRVQTGMIGLCQQFNARVLPPKAAPGRSDQ